MCCGIVACVLQPTKLFLEPFQEPRKQFWNLGFFFSFRNPNEMKEKSLREICYSPTYTSQLMNINEQRVCADEY